MRALRSLAILGAISLGGCSALFSGDDLQEGGSTAGASGGGATASGGGGGTSSSGGVAGGAAGSPSDAAAGSPSGGAAGSPSAGAAGSAAGGSCSCVSAAPDSSWLGPLVVAEYDGAPPSCPNGTTDISAQNPNLSGLGRTLDPGAHTCACDCQPSGTCPGTMTVDFFETTCSGSPCGTITATTTMCSTDPPGGCVNPSNYRIRQANVPCTATADSGQGNASFEKRLRACAASAMNCAGGVCAPPNPSPFEAPVCIGKAGDHVCPTGHPNKRTYFGSIDDTRACGACSCGDVQCDRGNIPCSVVPKPLGGCRSLNAPFSLRYAPLNTCGVATNASKSGTVTPTAPFTLCCAD